VRIPLSIGKLVKRLDLLTDGTGLHAVRKLQDMLALMLGVIRTQLEVLKTIVVSHVIFMMDLFSGKQVTPQMLFHHQDMRKNISLISRFPMSTRMLRPIHVNVSVRAFVASLEIPRMLSFHESSGCRISNIVAHCASICHDRQKINVSLRGIRPVRLSVLVCALTLAGGSTGRAEDAPPPAAAPATPSKALLQAQLATTEAQQQALQCKREYAAVLNENAMLWTEKIKVQQQGLQEQLQKLGTDAEGERGSPPPADGGPSD
jgi:hypothetical protein